MLLTRQIRHTEPCMHHTAEFFRYDNDDYVTTTPTPTVISAYLTFL